MIARIGPNLAPRVRTVPANRKHLARDGVEIIRMLVRRGPAESKMAKRLIKATIETNPEALGTIQPMLMLYAQVRYIYDQMDRVPASGTGFNLAGRAG